MLIGAHAIVHSNRPGADRAFFDDVLGLPSVDAGEGWLIFGLPPSELAVHTSELSGRHELYLMCDDIETFVAAMRKHNVACGPIQDQHWGIVTRVTLPGGGDLGIYQPRHARPSPVTLPKSKKARKPARRAAQTPAKRPAKKRGRRNAKPGTASKRSRRR